MQDMKNYAIMGQLKELANKINTGKPTKPNQEGFTDYKHKGELMRKQMLISLLNYGMDEYQPDYSLDCPDHFNDFVSHLKIMLDSLVSSD